MKTTLVGKSQQEARDLVNVISAVANMSKQLTLTAKTKRVAKKLDATLEHLPCFT